MTEPQILSRNRVKCREIMSGKVSSATSSSTLQEAARVLRDGDMGILPIVDEDGRLLGLLTDRDIVVRAVAEGKDMTSTLVGEVMTTELYTAGPDDFAFKAIRTMGERQVRRVPIVDSENLLVGILSIADIALVMEDEKEVAQTLEEISSGEGFWSKR